MRILFALESGHPVIDSHLFEAQFAGWLLRRTRFIPIGEAVADGWDGSSYTSGDGGTWLDRECSVNGDCEPAASRDSSAVGNTGGDAESHSYINYSSNNYSSNSTAAALEGTIGLIEYWELPPEQQEDAQVFVPSVRKIDKVIKRYARMHKDRPIYGLYGIPDSPANWLIWGIDDWYVGRANPWYERLIDWPSDADDAASVQDVLLRTKRGELISYAALARRAYGSSKAARAAGTACARNPMPLIVPCHRVVPSAVTAKIAAGETPSDYGRYAYGAALKKALIEYEAAMKEWCKRGTKKYPRPTFGVR